MAAAILRPPLWIRLLLAAWLLLVPAVAAAWSAPAESLEPALLEVRLNGQFLGEPVVLLRDPSGALYASAVSLQEWRIRLPANEPVRHEGALWYRIDDVPGLALSLAEESQTLTVDARPALFETSRTALGDHSAMEMTAPASGGFVNYDLFAEVVRGEASVSGAIEIGVFTPAGVGTATFIGRAGPGRDEIVRLETAWTVDRPASMTTLRLGDSISGAGPGARPLRFGGIQYARNFAVQPGFVTMPLPSLGGSAALPSVVEVYVNETLQGARDIQPGPFELTGIPVQTGGGTVQLVVRDLLGRQTVTEQSYYASARLLRRDLHDFSYEIGFVREEFGLKGNRYGELIASTSHRYGVSDRLTVEAHVQATKSVQLAGAGAAFSLRNLGLVAGSAAISRSRRGTGFYASGSFERRSLGLSFGLRSEYHGRGFAFAGMADKFRPPRFSAEAFADLPLFGGTIGANLAWRDHRNRPDETLAGIFGTFRIRPGASLHLFARRAVAERGETIIGGHLAFAFGGPRSAFASAEHRRGGASARVSYQHSPPAGIGSGFRIAAGTGEIDSAEASFVHQARFASVGAEISHVEGDTGVRVSAAGSIGVIGGKAFAARALGSSFAAVKVGDHGGVRVYADNQLVGVTGSDGSIVLPSLRAFDRNMIRIEEGDLPIDVLPAATEIAVRPFARSGVLVSFDAQAERGLMMQVRLEDGSFLPAGAVVEVEGTAQQWPVVAGGEVYVAGVEGEIRLRARWRGGSCSFAAAVPPGDDPQPRLEGLVCRRIVYAAG